MKQNFAGKKRSYCDVTLLYRLHHMFWLLNTKSLNCCWKPVASSLLTQWILFNISNWSIFETADHQDEILSNPSRMSFVELLPKVELHAHLSGSIRYARSQISSFCSLRCFLLSITWGMLFICSLSSIWDQRVLLRMSLIPSPNVPNISHGSTLTVCTDPDHGNARESLYNLN